MNQLERDLTYKLMLDIKKALHHFTELCEAVDVPAQAQWAHMVYTLSGLLIELVQIGSSAPKDFFLSMLGKMWDSRAKKKESSK